MGYERQAPRLLFAAAGAFAMLAQTLALREHMVLYGGNAVGVGLFFAGWLAWIAVGSALLLWRPRLRKFLSRRFDLLVLAYGPVLLSQLLLLRALPAFVGGELFAELPLGPLLGWTFVLQAPVCLLTGLLFPAGATHAGHDADDAAGTVARLYAWEAAGAFIGGLAVTGLTAVALPALDIAVGAGIAVALVVATGRDRLSRLMGLSIALLFAAGLVTPLGASLRTACDTLRDDRLLPGAELLESIETPYQHAAVFRRGEQHLLTLDGRISAGFPEKRRPKRIAALLLGQNPRPKRALLTGPASLSLARVLREMGVEHVTALVPGNAEDDRVLDLLRRHLAGSEREVLKDTGVSLLSRDLRRFLSDEEAEGDWDIVVLDLPDPNTAGGGRLSSVEALGALADKLAPASVVALRLRSAANVMTQAQAAYGGSVLATMEHVFADVAVFPGEETWLLASPEPNALLREPSALAARYQKAERRPTRLPAAVFDNFVEPERMRRAQEAFRQANSEGELVRDEHPKAFFHNLLVWVEEAAPAWASPLRALRGAGAWLVLIPLGIGLLLRSHRALTRGGPRPVRRRWNAAALMAALGGASIVLQLVLLLHFETHQGGLFWLVGLLNALFMAGLALGGKLGAQLVEHKTSRDREAGGEALGAAAATAGLLLAIAFPFALDFAAAAGPVGYATLALFAGLTLGVGFPCAARLGREGRDCGSLGAALLMADHWGAMLGAAVVGVLLLPLVGLHGTCFLAAATLGFPLLLIAGELAVERLPTGGSEPLKAWRSRRRHSSLPFDRVGYVLLFLALSVAALATITTSRLNDPQVRLDDAELRMLLSANRTELRDRPFPHRRAFLDATEEFVGAGATSAAAAPDVQGYGGRLNVQVVVDASGRIVDARLLQSLETPSYIVGLEAWLRQLVSHDVREPLHLDALTGATTTSLAVEEATRRTARKVAREVLDMDVPTHEPNARPWPPSLWYLFFAFTFAVPVSLRGGPWSRRVFLLSSVVLGGLLFNVVLSSTHVAALAHGRLPGTGDMTGFILVTGALGLGIFLGPLYCSLLCPLGALQELVGDACRAKAPSPRLSRRVRFLKYVVLAAVVLAGAFGASWFEDVDPLVHAFAFEWAVFPTALLVLVLVSSALFPRFWCRALCPVGALLNLTNAVALLRRLRQRRRPARCDMGTTRTHDLDCLQCNRCEDASPSEELRWPRQQP